MRENELAVKVREMILSGAFGAGQRVTEAALAEQLGVSRTPIRSLLPTLAGEGLLTTVGRRGYAVKAFSAKESLQAIELRSMIEGLAARIVAREGISDDLKNALEECLAEGDVLFEKRSIEPADELTYGQMNERFHSLIVAAADSGSISETYARIKLVPFAAPATIAFNELESDKAYESLLYAHRQHHAIVSAIKLGDAGRAEFLFREHANQPRHNLWPEEETNPARRRRHRLAAV